MRPDAPELQNRPLTGSTSPTRTQLPKGKKRDLRLNVLPRAPKLYGMWGDMSNGRSEKRIARAESLKISVPPEPNLTERISTENVSAHGARILMEQKLQPGQLVLIDSPGDGVRLHARIVYCQRVSAGRFAVGLELTGRVETWAKPY